MTSLTENINQIVKLTQDEISAIEKAYKTIEIPKGQSRYMFVCMCVCMYVCMYVFVYVCVCICVCL